MKLKSLALALIFGGFCLVHANSAQAQLAPRFGVKAGLGLSKMTGDTFGASFGTGFGFGGTAIFDMMPVSLVTDLYLARNNYGGVNSGSKTWDLVIPVQARFSVMPMLFIQGGASFSYGLGSYTEYTDIDSTSISYNLSPVKRTDLSLLFGLGSEIPLAVGSLQIEGRFAWGMLNRSRAQLQSLKTIHLDLLVGYLF